MIDHFSKYKKLAEKYNLSFDVIQKICDSQFDFCTKIIAEGKDEKIYLQYLGTFSVHPNRRKNLMLKRKIIKEINNGRFKNRQKK